MCACLISIWLLAVLQGGTRAAPLHFNDQNREEAANYWPTAAGCAYAVTLQHEDGGFIDDLGEEREVCRLLLSVAGLQCCCVCVFTGMGPKCRMQPA
jgi:hypothetical protein